MGSIRPLWLALLLAFCGVAGAQGPARTPPSSPPPAEITARNAAAGYTIATVATLGMLRDECEPLLGTGPDAAPAIALDWWNRNRADIETAYAWTERFLEMVRTTDPAEHQKLNRAATGYTGAIVQRNAQHLFRAQLPTDQSCRAALALFAAPQLDVDKLGAGPGAARFTEYGRTLERIRAERAQPMPPRMQVGPERNLHYGLTASLLAAQEATRRGDAGGVKKAYGRMAGRGDAKAAYQLGMMHMNGKVLEQDDSQAYRWFHRAWLLREAEAVNALGVLHRDGRAGPAGRPNPKLALALFQLAVVQATDPQSKARANRNLITLSNKLPLADRRAVACMTVREIANAVEQPMPLADRGSARQVDPGENERLAELLPQISSGAPVPCS